MISLSHKAQLSYPLIFYVMKHTSTTTINTRKNRIKGLKQFILVVFMLTLVFESQSQEVLSIGAGTSTQTYPFNYSNGYSRCAMIYTATEMGTSTNAKVLTSIGFYCNTAANTGPTVIRLKLVGSLENPGFGTWATLISGATQVYSGTPSNTTGYRTITLSTPFFVPAGQNLEILVETNYGGTGTGDSYGNRCRYTTGSTTSLIQANNTAPTGNLGVCGGRPNIQLSFNPPAYSASFTAMNTGSSNWCPGETRNVTVTVTNTGTATWTNSSPDINIGCKWNADADYLVRCDANNLAPGASQTYTLTMTAPTTLGSNNLTFDAVYEGCFWFAWNPGNTLCGTTCAGNSAYTSSSQYIVSAPAAANNPFPANAAANQCYSGGGAPQELSWDEVANAESYDVYFGAGSLPGSVTDNVTTTYYSLGALAANTTYYWKVVAKNHCGTSVGSSTWTFTTGSEACFCSSSASSTLYSDITSFSLNGNTNSSVCNVAASGQGSVAGLYSNFTTLGPLTTLYPGSTYSFSTAINNCSVGVSGYNWCLIYIDYDGNSEFTNSDELVCFDDGDGDRIVNGSLTVPLGATPGDCRLRAIVSHSFVYSSCGLYSSGETEDYLINIGSLPNQPGALVSNSPNCSNVTINCSNSAPAGETYYWQSDPTGTSTTNSSASIVVTSNGTYYLRSLRTSDGVWSLPRSTTVEVWQPTTAPTTPSPANSATNVCCQGYDPITSVSWAGSQYATSFDVYFGVGSLPSTVTANVSTNSYSCGTLQPNTTYVWKVVAKNSCGEAVGSSTWSFSTAAFPCACSSLGYNPASTYISNVTYEGINNNTSPSQYSNFTNETSATIYTGVSANLSVNVTSNNLAYVTAWIDWNNDYDFNDSGEQYLLGTASSPATILTTSITPPSNAHIGTLSMRITVQRDSEPLPCGSFNYGEVEDYSVVCNYIPQTPGALS